MRPLLPGSSSCAALITTRNRALGVAGARFAGLNVLSDSEALELFTRIVADDRPAMEPDATAEVLLACAGLPLAIRICAARLAARRQWRIATLAYRLQDERRRLDELRTGDLEVRAIFHVIYMSLRNRPRVGVINPARAFCLLGLWEGPEPTISLQAAAVLLGLSGEDDEASNILERLVDEHLLESPMVDGYQFHSLLRVYARERAEEDLTEQERASAVGRLHDWRERQRCDEQQSDHRQAATMAPGPCGIRGGVTDDSPDEAAASGNAASSPVSNEPSVTRTAASSESDDAGTMPAIPEPPLVTLRRMLADQGIVGRKQAEEFCAALIKSWPENPGHVAGTRDEGPGEFSGQKIPGQEVSGQASHAPSSAIPDAPGYELRPDPLSAKTPAEFVMALVRLRQWAGNPTYREMEKRCGHDVAFATICTALSGEKLPSQRVVLAIVTACVEDEDVKSSFITAWRQLAMTQEPGQRRRKKAAKPNLYPVPDTA